MASLQRVSEDLNKIYYWPKDPKKRHPIDVGIENEIMGIFVHRRDRAKYLY